MKKFLLLLVTMIISLSSWADADLSKINFAFAHSTAGACADVTTVSVTDNAGAAIDGVTATLACNTNVRGVTGVVTSGMLVPDANVTTTSATSPFTFTLTVSGLPEVTVNSVTTTNYGTNGGNGWNVSEVSSSIYRQANYSVSVNGGEAVQLTDVEIPSETSGESVSRDFDITDVEVKDGNLVLTLNVWKGTTNGGCFYALSGISLACTVPEPTPTSYSVSWTVGENGTASISAYDASTFMPTSITTSPATFAADYVMGFSFVITPNEGYEVDEFTVNGVDKKSELQESDGKYAWQGVAQGSTLTADMALAVTFKATAPEPTPESSLKSGCHYSIYDSNKSAYWSPSNKVNSKYSSSSTPNYFDVTVDGSNATLKDQYGYYVGIGSDKYVYSNSDAFQWTIGTVEGSEGVYTLYQDKAVSATGTSTYKGYAGFTTSSKSVYLNNTDPVNLKFTPALKVTYKFVDGEGTSLGDDQIAYLTAGSSYSYTLPTGYKYVSGAPEKETVEDATAADETYTIVCAVDNITWTVGITGAPEGSEPTVTVAGTEYKNGDTFIYNSALTTADVTASAIDGYLSKVAVSHTETEGTVSVTYTADMTPVLPEGYVLKIGSTVAPTMTPATGAKDNDHWYVLTQVRGGESMAYNNGTSTMKRGSTSETAESIDGKAISANLKYLVRFLPTEYTGVYNMQFADGKFVQTTLVTGAQETAGQYFFYNINGTEGHYGWNLTTDGTTYGSRVDNNAAGETLSFWDSGIIESTGGNNDWYIYTAEFVEPTPAVELTASATTAMVNTDITLTATASAFESDPTIAISYTKNGGEATALEGTIFTPTEPGKYVFTATATLGDVTATSKEVTINVMSDQYAGTWWLKNNDANLYATYGTGYYGTEANLGETAKEVTFSIVNGAYNIKFEGQSKWLGQNSWDKQCYADGPQAAYTIEEVDGGIQIMTGSNYLTYAWDSSYSVNNIVWGTTASTWTLVKPQPLVTLAASATEVTPGTEITLTATTKNFDETPTIAYSVAIDGGEATALEGNTYTPAADGTYVFTATATTDTQSATSNAVTVNVASEDPADAELAATLVGDWIENTTGQFYDDYNTSGAGWYDFTITNGAVTATADGRNVTFTGLLGDSSHGLVAKVDASEKTLTFAKGQTIYYGGYDYTLTYDPDAQGTEADLVATINEDGSLSLDGLSIYYPGYGSYMYQVISKLSRKSEPTAISSVTGAYTSALRNGKFIQNGRVIVVKNGKTYTTNGQLVK